MLFNAAGRFCMLSVAVGCKFGRTIMDFLRTAKTSSKNRYIKFLKAREVLQVNSSLKFVDTNTYRDA